MHECYDCGQACDCDMEDHWNDNASDDCCHQCDPADLNEYEEDFEESDYRPPTVSEPESES